MKNISIIGKGYVGNSLIQLFKDHYPLIIKDKNYLSFTYPDKIKDYLSEDLSEIDDEQEMRNEVNKADLGIIAVPTPMKEDKSCNISIVEEVISWLETPVILIKSTVPPGTTNMLKNKYHKRICFSPEYAGESSYYTPPEYQSPTDMKQHPYVVIGGDSADRVYIIDLLTPILGPTKKYFQCSAKESEAVKYFENVLFSAKITFANEMRNICEAMNIDYYMVREGWLLDPRICPMHTLAMAEKESGGRGFGGKCLIKDTNALIQASLKAGYNPKFLKQILLSNDEFIKIKQR